MRSCIGSRALCSVCACRFRRRIRNRSDQRSMDDFGQGWYFIGCDSGRDSSCTICSDHTRQWGEVCQKVCIKLAKLGHVQLRVDEPFPPPPPQLPCLLHLLLVPQRARPSWATKERGTCRCFSPNSNTECHQRRSFPDSLSKFSLLNALPLHFCLHHVLTLCFIVSCESIFPH